MITQDAKAAAPIRLLGVDPGLRVTGYGIIEVWGSKTRYISSGVIRIPAGDLPPRLGVIFDGLCEVARTHRVQAAAIEKVFVNVNPSSTLLLGQARGAAITALVHCGLPVEEFTALQIKQSVVGYGRATKEQMQKMVQALLHLPGEPSKDAADALGCALCAAQSRSMIAQTRREADNAALVGSTDRVPPSLASKGLRIKRGRLVTV